MKDYCQCWPTDTQVSAYRELEWMCSTVKKDKFVPVYDFKALGSKEL